MAEGGQNRDFPSIKDGSDADFDIKCTPCGEDNIREEAVKYCPECQSYLCVTCTRYHGRLKALQSHKLFDTDDVKHGPMVASKCLYHPDRDIEMYCSTHDMVYCTMCIATEHRSCSGVNRIEDEQLGTQDTEIQNLLDETENVYKRMKAMTTKKQNNIDSLEEQRQAIKQTIMEVGKRIIEHTRKLERDILDSLDKNFTNIKSELESEISAATNMIQDFDKTAKQIQTVTDGSPRQQFVQMKITKKAVADANKLHKASESSGTKAFFFAENTELMNSVMTATALGQVTMKVTERKGMTSVEYKMKSRKEINVKMSNDNRRCVISDVCQLEDGTVLLSDRDNNKVKRLDTNYNIKDHCDLDSGPTGICAVDKNEVAVKMSNNKVQFISVGTTLSKTRCMSVTHGTFWGMTCFGRDLLVSGSGSVNVYSLTGTLIKSFAKDQNGKLIFKTPIIQHMAVSNDTVIVTDYSDGAVCLNRDGTVTRELRDGRLTNTRGVCVTDDGTVFLSGYNSHNIVIFSNDGRCLGELMSRAAGLKDPISLCYDRNKRCIIVTRKSSNNIHIIQVS